MKRFFRTTVVAMAFMAVFAAAAVAKDKISTLTVLHTNDHHGTVSSERRTGGARRAGDLHIRSPR